MPCPVTGHAVSETDFRELCGTIDIVDSPGDHRSGWHYIPCLLFHLAAHLEKMSQSVYAQQGPSHYIHDNAINTSDYASAQTESPVVSEFTFLNSRVFWLLALLVALAVAHLARKENLPAGVKRLPKLPGM